MATVLVLHQVKDYGKWRKIYDSARPMQAAGGVIALKLKLAAALKAGAVLAVVEAAQRDKFAPDAPLLVVDDVLAGLDRRGWAGRLVWAFAPVQDRHAAPRIAAALRELAAIEEVEVVIVARGGGSLADLFAFCDEALCRTVSLLRVPVISSVGHHTDRTLIDDVAAVCCSTPTHAAEAAVRVDCNAARSDLLAQARRLDSHGRGAVLSRARALAHLSRAPAEHVARHRRHLHQMLRELRASAKRKRDQGQSLAGVHTLVLRRSADRARGSGTVQRGRELERLSIALGGHDPERTLARGYAMGEDRAGEPLASAAAAQAAGEVAIRFHDGALAARIGEDNETER